MPASATHDRIRSQCQELITAGLTGDYARVLTAFDDLENDPDRAQIEPVMAAAFARVIIDGCRALGAVRNGIPIVTIFEHDERHTFARLSNTIPMPAQQTIAARRLYRRMQRLMRAYLQTTARGDHAQVNAAYANVPDGDTGHFLFMLWRTATTAQNYMKALAVLKRSCPGCRPALLARFSAGQSINPCGHLDDTGTGQWCVAG